VYSIKTVFGGRSVRDVHRNDPTVQLRGFSSVIETFRMAESEGVDQVVGNSPTSPITVDR